MNAEVRQGLWEIIYSVIEKGVCRIVTSQCTGLLDELKTAYSQNVPENHQLLWLPGNICSLEQLSHVLVEANVLEASPDFDHQQLLQRIKAHLIICHQQHILEIWVFENAEHISAPVVELLAELITWKHFDSLLFSFELWGNAQLDALYHSQALEVCCRAHHYYIPVGQSILVKKTPAKRSIWFASGFAILALGILLGSSAILLTIGPHSQTLTAYFNPDVNDLEPELTIEPLKQTGDLVFKPDDQNLAKKPTDLELVLPGQINQQGSQAKDVVATSVDLEPVANSQITQQLPQAEVNYNRHLDAAPARALNVDANNGLRASWYFSLDFSAWQEKYQIDLMDDIDRSKGMFYLQLGLYKKQISLEDFFIGNVLSNKTYHFCYLQKSKLVALLSGAYPTVRKAFDASEALASAGYFSKVVGVDDIKQWQCSN